jgi:hypothetical protein
MQPIDLLGSALAAGALSKQKAGTEPLILQLYAQMKSHIHERYPNVSLQELEDHPASTGALYLVKENLHNNSAMHDEPLLSIAEDILKALQLHHPEYLRALGIDLPA